MSRVVAFGCSYTYGQGLEDCHVEPNLPGPQPSKFAWPRLVAKELNYECVNMGTPAFSNLAILNSMLNFTFQPDDIVLVMWSFKTRDMEFKKSDTNVHKGRWLPNYISTQNIYDLVIKGYLHIHHADCFLKLKGLKYYFLDADRYFTLEDTDTPVWVKELNFVPFDFKKYEYFPPLGLDNLHPGPVFHKLVAKTLLDKIRQ